MLIDAYSGCNNREDLNNAYNKIMPVFISPKHQVGLKLKTGIDMEDVVRHGLTRAQNRGYSRRGGLNRETLNAELREAAKAIANADIFMYYADKIDGIDKFLKEGNKSELDPDSLPVFSEETLREADEYVRDYAENIEGRPVVPAVPKTKEELAEAQAEEPDEGISQI